MSNTLPALPSAQTLTPATIAEASAQLVAWAEQATDPAEVNDTKNKWAAITDYIRRTSREGVAEAEGALRRLEVRVGELLGPAKETNGRPFDRDLKVGPDARSDFRKMAEHRDVVEAVIAASTDTAPPSRSKVLNAIRATEQADEDAREEVLLREALAVRGFNVDPTPTELAAMERERRIVATALGVVMEMCEGIARCPAVGVAEFTGSVSLPTLAEIDTCLDWLRAIRPYCVRSAA
jgi:hypothetical protein